MIPVVRGPERLARARSVDVRWRALASGTRFDADALERIGKFPFFGVTPGAVRVLPGRILPLEPVDELFARAWRSAVEGDAPAHAGRW